MYKDTKLRLFIATFLERKKLETRYIYTMHSQLGQYHPERGENWFLGMPKIRCGLW